MNAQEARKIFDSAIAETANPDEIDKLELLREYFTNLEFRNALEEYTYNLNQSVKSFRHIYANS